MKKIIVFLIGLILVSAATAGDVITLTWDQVIGIGLKQNLDLRIMRQDYRNQSLNQWKAAMDFLPTVNYSFRAVNNIELPVMVFMGRSFRVGTKYNFSHVFQAQLPIFLGGLRFANYSIQKNSKRSLKALLKGKESDIALKSVEAYFQVILSNDLVRVNQRAVDAARANFEQVQKFYNTGAASRLDLLRAKTRLSQSLPALTSAENNRKMAVENLKYLLNFNVQDSIVVLDSLKRMDFLKDFATLPLEKLQEIALKNRSDLKSLAFRKKAVGAQKIIAGSHFLPQIVLSADVQHQAYLDNSKVQWNDYTRAKSASIGVQFPLFEGGKRIIEMQQAIIQNKKITLQLAQMKRAVLLNVKNSFNSFKEARQNLQSLKQAFKQAKETLRLANLTYKEGLSTQVDVLNAQAAFTASELQYRQGIFKYNVAQLELLKAIGKLETLWQ